MKLSIALIVKNEAYILEKCLSSVKEADEIIVVDTGSTDNTVEIAKKFTDKIYHFEWSDDFAGARNYALSKCTGNWILTMDADWILENSIEEVLNTIDGVHDAFSVRLNASSGGYHYLPVLFKRGLIYSGKVHEYLNPKNVGTSNLQITYYPNNNKLPDRNLNILLTMEKTPRTLFYLSKEYLDLGIYEKAVKSFDEYIKVSSWIDEKAEAYYYKAKALWYSNRGDEARVAIYEAIKLNPDMKKALLLCSEMHYEPWKSKWLNLANYATDKDVIFN
jgi:glycosyltransferase involved in cell wall biosynthesis